MEGEAGPGGALEGVLECSIVRVRRKGGGNCRSLVDDDDSLGQLCQAPSTTASKDGQRSRETLARAGGVCACAHRCSNDR